MSGVFLFFCSFYYWGGTIWRHSVGIRSGVIQHALSGVNPHRGWEHTPLLNMPHVIQVKKRNIYKEQSILYIKLKMAWSGKMERNKKMEMLSVVNDFDSLLDCTMSEHIEVVRYTKDDKTFILVNDFATGNVLVIDEHLNFDKHTMSAKERKSGLFQLHTPTDENHINTW